MKMPAGPKCFFSLDLEKIFGYPLCVPLALKFERRCRLWGLAHLLLTAFRLGLLSRRPPLAGAAAWTLII